jgi:uncharacterized membrane protein YkvA (DUF1232 family)
MSAKKANPFVKRLRRWVRELKCDVHALYLSARDPRVPWYAKAMALGVAAYALSPVDLIPDFIPVIGHLDDLIIVPLGIWLAVRLIPANVLNEHRETARRNTARPASKSSAAVSPASRSPMLARGFPSHTAQSQIPTPNIRKTR